MKIGCVDCLVKVRGKISKSLPNSIYKVSFDCFTFKMQTVKGKECNTHSLTISAHLLFPLPPSFTFKCYHRQPLIAKLPSASLPPSGWLNEAGASRARYQHCRKWMFWVRNLHPERAIYGNVYIML